MKNSKKTYPQETKGIGSTAQRTIWIRAEWCFLTTTIIPTMFPFFPPSVLLLVLLQTIEVGKFWFDIDTADIHFYGLISTSAQVNTKILIWH